MKAADAAPSAPEQETPREGGPFKEEQPAAPVQQEQAAPRAEKEGKNVCAGAHYFAFMWPCAQAWWHSRLSSPFCNVLCHGATLAV